MPAKLKTQGFLSSLPLYDLFFYLLLDPLSSFWLLQSHPRVGFLFKEWRLKFAFNNCYKDPWFGVFIDLGYQVCSPLIL